MPGIVHCITKRFAAGQMRVRCDYSVMFVLRGFICETSARIARRTVNFCFCSCDLVCGGEIVLVASGVFKVPDVDKIPAELRAKVLGKWGD